MHGQGLTAAGHDPLAETMPLDEAAARLQRIGAVVAAAAAQMPDHDAFIARHCAARA